MSLPRVGPRELVYRDPYQQIYRVTADFGGFSKEYFVRDTGQRVGVVIVRDGSVLLVRQYRLLIHGLSWEIPGGRVEEGETPEATAVRECLEEAGVRCQALKPLLRFHPGLDILHNPTHLFYTEGPITEEPGSVSSKEVQERAWVPLSRCVQMIFHQQIVDGLSLIGVLAYGSQINR